MSRRRLRPTSATGVRVLTARSAPIAQSSAPLPRCAPATLGLRRTRRGGALAADKTPTLDARLTLIDELVKAPLCRSYRAQPHAGEPWQHLCTEEWRVLDEVDERERD